MPGFCLGICNQFRNCIDGYRWIDHDNKTDAHNASDRRNIADEIEIELLVKCRIDRRRERHREERISVRRCTDDRLGANVGAPTRPVIDDELLTKPLRKPLTHQAGEDVLRASWRGTDDVAHRPRRIDLRPRDARDGRQRRSARGQMEKISAAE